MAVFLRGERLAGRGGCVDKQGLLMEKAHNAHSVQRLTLDASQRRTKPAQSSGPCVAFFGVSPLV